MREILFRGKIENGTCWVAGQLFLVEGDPVIYDVSDSENTDRWRYGEAVLWGAKSVIPSTIGQYTGLTDKNGKKIFEGDIVHHWNNSDLGYDTGHVFWDDRYCGWRRTTDGTFHQNATDTYRLDSSCVYEVIGNIHDNPELLGGAERDR